MDQSYVCLFVRLFVGQTRTNVFSLIFSHLKNCTRQEEDAIRFPEKNIKSNCSLKDLAFVGIYKIKETTKFFTLYPIIFSFFLF